MRRLSLACLLLVACPALLSTAVAAAQSASDRSFPTDAYFWEISGQAGFFVPEEPKGAEIEARQLFSLRGGYRRATGFGFELHGGYTPLDFEARGREPQEFDLNTFLYGGDVTYGWAISPRSDFFISAGVGGITWSLDSEIDDEADKSETNLRVGLGAGLHYLLTSSLAVRADLRDHLVFDQLADVARELALVDRGTTNNLEGSLGLSFVLP